MWPSCRTTPGWSSAVRLAPVRPAHGPPRPRSAGFPYDTTMDAAIPSAPSNAPAARAAQQALVVSSLAKILPASCILFRGEETAPYECDALTAYRQLPLVVVIPESEAQVAAVLAACHALTVPVVARGAGTGLSGG